MPSFGPISSAPISSVPSSVAIAYMLSAAQGAYSVTGQIVTFARGRTLVAAQGAYALSGKVVTFSKGLHLSAVQGAYTLTGKAVTFSKGLTLSVTQGAYALSGKAVAFGQQLHMFVAQGVYQLRGTPILLSIPVIISAIQRRTAFVLSQTRNTSPSLSLQRGVSFALTKLRQVDDILGNRCQPFSIVST